MKESIDKLKERPQEDKTAIAGTAALLVGVILFAGWGYFFIKKIKKGEQIDSTIIGNGQDVFDFSSLDQITQDFANQYRDDSGDLERVREESAAREADALPREESASDPFGSESGL